MKEKTAPSYSKGQLYEIPVNDIKPDPNQPRKYFDKEALEELADSIKKNGVVQPIIFRVDDKGKLIIIAGERRHKAAKKLKLETIPGLFNDGDPSEIALIENLLRQDLTAIEEAEAMSKLKEERQYTDEQLGEVLGKKRSTISDMLLLSNLPQEVRDECRDKTLYARRELIKIARKKTQKAMATAFRKYKEQLAKREQTGGKRGPRSPKVEVLEKSLDSLKTRIEKISEEWDETDITKISPKLKELKTAIDTLLKNG